ncbi:unnamed protein product [Rotaria sp. Silwood1]|nr:unnamed protein product [Rotaria sp. Silwood1]CAF1478857.1 unnamed protein product [Rotaria sp. Silwood1]CAF3614198.1 unnamed protein product [Rotaria sp. Silwood1]CAF3673848.1 unnamed protein product [Rotaria sp. Silwood1]CAF3706919.1 unnamed protein product [Rotaria sp. Silwood1]
MIADVSTRLISALSNNQSKFSPILGFPLTSANARRLDLSVHNKELQKFTNLEDYANTLDINFIWLGGYGEERNIYAHADLFSQDNRCIHLGVDIALKPNTPIYAPLNGRIHSFKNNDKPFDYGPTIILEHDLGDNIHFYTLYGHLSINCLKNLTVGQLIEQGQLVGDIGDKSENGGWNPHVHFQIISDIENMQGDYPGVASKQDAPIMLHKCPDPQFILGFPDKPIIY